jgi:pimeloyl-ACP methyl ester carboxylesterase
MNSKQIGVMAVAAALPVMGGLAYRKYLQRRTAQSLAVTNRNGIVEECFIPVGGIPQWIQIRGEDRRNPVLLILHGGPGWPNAVFNLPLRSWESHFTVVQWDQRGTGKTLGRSGKDAMGAMTFEHRIADAVEVSEYLRQYLEKDRLVLLAESMGTLVGVPLVKRRPDLFSAIVATDLYVEMARNEALKYQMTLARLRAAGDTKGASALEKIGGDPLRWDLKDWNVNMAMAFKTNVPTPNLDRSLLFPLLLTSPLYSLRDIISVFSGFQFSTVKMFEEIKTYNARRFGAQFEIPFFLFQGESDVITLTGLAEEYFAEVEAPQKQMALIKNAGHFAAFTQPEQFLSELIKHVRPMAI